MDEKNCVRLYICSPLRAETKNQVAKNRRLALEYELAVRKCIQNHLQREETESAIVRTYAPHGHMSVLLDDVFPDEREIALNTGKQILNLCDGIVVCGGRMSSGMKEEVVYAAKKGLPIYMYGVGVSGVQAMAVVSEIKECLYAARTVDGNGSVTSPLVEMFSLTKDALLQIPITNKKED